MMGGEDGKASGLTYQINDMSCIPHLGGGKCSNCSTKRMSRHDYFESWIFCVGSLYSIEDFIADFAPTSPISFPSQTACAQVDGDEREVKECAVISEGFAAAESYYDQGVCKVEGDVAGCVCQLRAKG